MNVKGVGCFDKRQDYFGLCKADFSNANDCCFFSGFSIDLMVQMYDGLFTLVFFYSFVIS